MKARTLWLLVLVSLCWVAPAIAADDDRHPLEIRPRAGVGIGPDQAVVGLGVFLRPRLVGLRIAPSVDFGFGDNVTTTLLNIDLLTPSFALNDRSGIYAGAGFAVGFFNREAGFGTDHTEANVNVVAGVDIRRFFIEGRFGFDKLPDARVLGGFRFIM
jgi:hypothetical protein